MLSNNDIFEIKARLFMDETSYLAPGKDSPIGANDNHAERAAAWRIWLRYNEDTVERVIRAMEGMGYAD